MLKENFDSEKIESLREKSCSGVGAIVENSKGEILFVIESNQKQKPWKQGGQISIPFGTLKEKESFEDSMVRELEEETGISISKDLLDEKGDIVLSCDKQKLTIPIKIFHICIAEEEMSKALGFKNCEISSTTSQKLEEIKKTAMADFTKIRPGTLESLFVSKTRFSWQIFVNIENGKYSNTYQSLLKEVILKNLHF